MPLQLKGAIKLHKSRPADIPRGGFSIKYSKKLYYFELVVMQAIEVGSKAL